MLKPITASANNLLSNLFNKIEINTGPNALNNANGNQIAKLIALSNKFIGNASGNASNPARSPSANGINTSTIACRICLPISINFLRKANGTSTKAFNQNINLLKKCNAGSNNHNGDASNVKPMLNRSSKILPNLLNALKIESNN